MTQREWRLHPQTVEMIWNEFGCAELDLFASAENTHYPGFFFHDRVLNSGSGRARPPLAKSLQVCFLSNEHPSSGTVQKQTGEGTSSASCAEMAHPALVPGPS